MKYSIKKPTTWTTVRKHLETLEKPELVALLKDLYRLSPLNKACLNARVDPDECDSEVFLKYRKLITDQFFPARGEGQLKLGEARKVIRDYRKATGSVRGTAELMMTYVESGAEYTHQYGDIWESFYSSIESVLDELVNLIRREGQELYPEFSDRLLDVVDLTNGIGWGFHDYIAEVVMQLDADLGDGEDDED